MEVWQAGEERVGQGSTTWSFHGLSAAPLCACSQLQLRLWSGINCTFAYQLVNMDGPFAGAIILQIPCKAAGSRAGHIACIARQQLEWNLLSILQLPMPAHRVFVLLYLNVFFLTLCPPTLPFPSSSSSSFGCAHSHAFCI